MICVSTRSTFKEKERRGQSKLTAPISTGLTQTRHDTPKTSTPQRTVALHNRPNLAGLAARTLPNRAEPHMTLAYQTSPQQGSPKPIPPDRSKPNTTRPNLNLPRRCASQINSPFQS